MQAQQPSWFRGFGAAGWIKCQCQISDINQQPPPLSAAAAMPFYSPPTPPPPRISFHSFLPLSICFFLQPCTLTDRQSRLCYEWRPLAYPEEASAPAWLYKRSPLSWEWLARRCSRWQPARSSERATAQRGARRSTRRRKHRGPAASRRRFGARRQAAECDPLDFNQMKR